MKVVDVMKNKVAITISALCVSLYGLAGFWLNLGNETIEPVLFASIIAANVIALILIIISAYSWSKEQLCKNTVRNGVICLILSAICFAVFAVLSANEEHIGAGKDYSFIMAVFVALGIASVLYSVSFMLFSAIKKIVK